jgi:hypothetical protein
MKSLFCFLFFTLAISSSLVSQSLNQWIPDPETDEMMLVGYGDRQGLENSDFNAYFKREYKAYIPVDTICNYLKNNTDSIEITIVLGTWCHDSQEQVPRFYRILDEIDFNTDNLSMIGVDRNKTGGEVDISALDIKLVPTFILFRNEKELGRIIETPMLSLEGDMMTIIRQK